jgi:hypothetical protein
MRGGRGLGQAKRSMLMVLGLGLLAACGQNQERSAPAPTACPTAADGFSGGTSAPPARGYHAMVSMGSKLGIAVLGGETAPPPASGHIFMDLWAYQAGGWVELARGSSRTSDGPAVYDIESNRLFVLGEIAADFHDNRENWDYDPATNRWGKRDLGDRPTAAAFMAYDSESDRTILFDGDGKTWAYDLNTDKWTQKAPESAPPIRTWFAISYDQRQDRVVLFGGLGDKDMSDTWIYDDSTDTWKNMSPAKSPPARHYSSMAYDPGSRQTILFGGVTGHGNSETPLCDTWAYDLAKNVWTQLLPSTSPSARGWHAMAFDEAIGKIVLFGGGADRIHFRNDTWLFDPSSNTWSRVS